MVAQRTIVLPHGRAQTLVTAGAPGRGVALNLSSTWGTASSDATQRLRSQQPSGLAVADRAAGAGRLDAELGYGLEALERARRATSDAAPEHRLALNADLRW